MAEEGFDVRACPSCGFFFHDTYIACPGCAAELVPAVEVFEDGQLEPDRVIVCHGEPEEMDWLGGELRKAGFDAESFEVVIVIRPVVSMLAKSKFGASAAFS